MTPEERERLIDKHNEAIQGLIIVSRTMLTSIEELRETQREDHRAWREAQATTDEKLNILIDTVDRIIRLKNEPPPLS